MSDGGEQVVDYQEGSATYYHAGNAIVIRLRSLDRLRFNSQYAARMSLEQARELWKDIGYALGETDPAVGGTPDGSKLLPAVILNEDDPADQGSYPID